MSDKNETDQQQQQQHIPTDPKQEDDSGETQQKGLLSAIGDPVGNVLNTALRPLGAPLEKGVTGPLGNALGGTTRPALGPLLGHDEERSELLGGKNKDSYEKGPDRIAGREQTGENPLGLDGSGRWGFEEGGGGRK